MSGPEDPPFAAQGLTRQHGNLSFTRVFQAGHMVPSYQPEAALRIFERALLDRDIATGAVDLRTTGGWAGAGAGGQQDDVFRTEGPGDTWWRRNELLPAPGRKCYILQFMSCSREEIAALREGRAVVRDFVIVDIEEAGRAAGVSQGVGEGSHQELQIALGADEL